MAWTLARLRTSRYRWIAVLIAVAVGVVLLLRSRPRFGETQFEQLREGMTKSEAVAVLGCPPGDAVFVGDSVHDVLAGNAAGVRTMGALWGPFGRDDLAPGDPKHYVTTISEVIDLL